jgi:hypothetical protein
VSLLPLPNARDHVWLGGDTYPNAHIYDPGLSDDGDYQAHVVLIAAPTLNEARQLADGFTAAVVDAEVTVFHEVPPNHATIRSVAGDIVLVPVVAANLRAEHALIGDLLPDISLSVEMPL